VVSDPEGIYPNSMHGTLAGGALVAAHQEFAAWYFHCLGLYRLRGGCHHLALQLLKLERNLKV
jgi:hypothetical protein